MNKEKAKPDITADSITDLKLIKLLCQRGFGQGSNKLLRPFTVTCCDR